MKRPRFFGGLLLRPPILLAFMLYFGLLSCKKKDETSEIVPVPTLKSISTVQELPAGFSVDKILTESLLEYTNDKLSKVKSNYTSTSADGEIEAYEVMAILTNTGIDEYKLISDAYLGAKKYINTTTARKVNGVFEIIQQDFIDTNNYTLLTLEEDANKQATKIAAVKTVKTGTNGVTKETPIGYAQRWEYDTNGNATKVYYKINSTDKEYLALENTYDNNPNPLKVMSWYYRLSGTTSESNNNILTTKQYDTNGKLIGEVTTAYIYDTNKYPITATQTGKSYVVGSEYFKTLINYKY